jgi:hypothetical protein
MTGIMFLYLCITKRMQVFVGLLSGPEQVIIADAAFSMADIL